MSSRLSSIPILSTIFCVSAHRLGENVNKLQEVVDQGTVGQEFLVSNITGNRLYVKGKGFWGRIWKWFYCLEQLVDRGHWLKCNRFVAATHKTQEAMFDQLEAIEADVKKLADYIALATKGIENPKKPLLKMNASGAARLVEWARYSGPLFVEEGKEASEAFVKERLQAITKLFTSFITAESAKDFDQPETISRILRAVSHREIIQLEQTAGLPLPLKIISQITQKKDASVKIEEQPVKTFFARLIQPGIADPSKVPLPLARMHRVLATLFKAFACSASDFEDSLRLGCLEVFLREQNGFHDYMLAPDEEHKKGMLALANGSKVTCNGRVIQLGEQIIGRHANKNRHAVFKVAKIEGSGNGVLDAEQLILKINLLNSATLAMGTVDHYHAEQHGQAHARPPLTELIEVDRSGVCSLYRRLKLTPKAVAWPPMPVGALAATAENPPKWAPIDDNQLMTALELKICKVEFNQLVNAWLYSFPDEASARRLLSLVTLIQKMVKGGYVYADLSPAQFAYDDKGVLRMTQGMEESPFNWYTVVKFIEECSAGSAMNLLYCYLMAKGGLVESQPDAEHYFTVMQCKLLEKPSDAKYLSAVEALTSTNSHGKIGSLESFAEELIGEYVRDFKLQYKVPDADSPNGPLILQIMQKQRMYHSPTRMLHFPKEAIFTAAAAFCGYEKMATS